MRTERKKRPSRRRRLLLLTIGYISLALDRLEGKSPPPAPRRTGRIKIVS